MKRWLLMLLLIMAMIIGCMPAFASEVESEQAVEETTVETVAETAEETVAETVTETAEETEEPVIAETEELPTAIESGRFLYKVNGTKATITGLVDINETNLNLVIPATIDGYTVVAIGNNAFSGNVNIKSVTLPDTLTEIGYGAFNNCKNLTGTLTLPASLISFSGASYNAGAFEGTAITELIVKDGSGALKFKQYTFRNCTSLVKVTLPGRVTVIGDDAFSGCASLTTVNWSAGTSAQTIGARAFTATKLSSFVCPSSLETISTNAFNGIQYLKSVTLNEGLVTIGDGAFSGCTGLTGKLVIPSTVTSFSGASYDGGAFAGTSISELEILGGTKTLNIKSYTFAECKRLTKVTLPARVLIIGSKAFEGDTALKTFSWADGLGIQRIEDSAFVGTSLASFVAPSNLEYIGTNAFSGVESLKSVTFNEGLKTIADGAFKECTRLTGTLTLPSSLSLFEGASYEDGAFAGTSITEVVVESGNEPLAIKSYTFENCLKLKKVTLPERVKSIGAYAFNGAASLSEVIWEGGMTQSIGDYAFVGTRLNSFVCPTGLVSIGQSAFKGVTALTTVEFNEGLTTIAAGAFKDCTGLSGTLTLPSTLSKFEGAYYDDGAFENTNYSEVIITDGVVELFIKGNTFTNCKNLKKVTLPGRVSGLGHYAFDGASALTTVLWDGGVFDQTIGQYAFRGTALFAFKCPDTLVSIDERAFQGVKTLISVTFNEGLTSIGVGAFKDCTNLTGTLVLPTTLTELPGSYYNDGAFENTGITEVVIKDDVANLNIHARAFANCKQLAKVTLPGRTTSIHQQVFQGCEKLTTLKVTEIDDAWTFKNLPIVEVTGYTYDKWYTQDGTGVTTTGEMLQKGTNTVYLRLVPNVYTVNFNANGGTVSIAKTSVTYHEPYGELPVPTRNNYKFIGWYTQSSGGTLVTADTLVATASNHYIYAQWVKNNLETYAVTYNANGGTNAPATQTKIQNTNLKLSSSIPTKTYTITFNANGGVVTPQTVKVVALFKNWNTKADGSGVPYNAGDTYTNNAAVTLYAQYNVARVGNVPVPTRDGFIFTGWYTAATGGNLVSEDTELAANTTLYARWVAEGEGYVDPVEAFVTQLYQICLNREPDSVGLAGWTSQLKKGNETGVSAAYGFIFSQEFLGKNLCNEDYVKQLYKAFLGREADAGGLAAWVSVLESGRTREHVFNGFALSIEFAKLCESYGIVQGKGVDESGRGTFPTGPCTVCGKTTPVIREEGVISFVRRMYLVCLGRDADSEGLNAWAKTLRDKRESGRGVAYGFIFSEEFMKKNYDNGEYVEHLYRAFMGRGSDPTGKAAWVGQLDRGISRLEVFEGFVGSDEFTKICNEYGILRD